MLEKRSLSRLVCQSTFVLVKFCRCGNWTTNIGGRLHPLSHFVSPATSACFASPRFFRPQTLPLTSLFTAPIYRMTTVDKVHDVFMSYKGRSPQQIYFDACKSLRCEVNSRFHAGLSTKIDDFFYLEDLDVSSNYFGPRGCLAVLQIVQSQHRLKSLNLHKCGVDDEVVAQLVEVMQDHPRLRSVNLSGNTLISVYSGRHFARVIKHNVSIVHLNLSDTRIGKNVADVLNRRCHANLKMMEEYFSDDWFHMKDMFLGLDVDGSGWVNLRNVVGSVVFPLVQEKLEERIKLMKPKKREDNAIDINSFLELTYLNYKTRAEILQRMDSSDGKSDPAEQNVRANWKLLAAEFKKCNAECADLHRVRIRDKTLAASAVSQMVQVAIEKASKTPATAATETSATPSDGAPNNDAVRHVSSVHLWQAVHAAPTQASPATGRARQSFMNAFAGKTWKLPVSFLRLVIQMYRDAAMASGPTLAVHRLLTQPLETDLEWLRLDLLKPQFAKFSIPLEETLLSMEETVNLLDEYYDVVRVPKPLALSAIS